MESIWTSLILHMHIIILTIFVTFHFILIGSYFLGRLLDSYVACIYSYSGALKVINRVDGVS